jgi:hypothetical protein
LCDAWRSINRSLCLDNDLFARQHGFHHGLARRPTPLLMRPRAPSFVRRCLARTATLAAGLTLVSTGLVLPAQRAAAVPDVKAKVQALADAVVGPGFSRQVETGLGAEMVGFEWAGQRPGAVEVRTRDGDQIGPWVEVHGDPTEGPDAGSPENRGKTTAGPVWLGTGVKDVEVRVTEGDLPGLKLHAIDSETPGTPSGPTTTRAGAAIAKPTVITRAAWGADESFRTINPGCSGKAQYASRVRYAIVHHTATANTYTEAEAPAVVRGIYYFHTHTNGWCDIGYNFLVDRFGNTYEGRAGGITEAVIGAHAAGFNSESTGVAIIGTFTTDPVPGVAYAALRDLLAWRLAWAGADPQATLTVGGKTFRAVAGHRDVNNTDCPGDQLEGMLSQLRGELASRLRASIAKPALHRSQAATFLLRDTQTSGAPTSSFTYGDAGDRGLMCDWDGDGVRTPGVQRPSTGRFYLRNSNTSGVADVELTYGNPDDIPICGDWDGDGIDSVGVVRGGTWYLKNSHQSGVADVTFGYGNPGDHVIVGDWDGNGTDTPGVQRDGPWYLRNANTTGVADLAPFLYGDAGDNPVAGDWNGDGIDTIGIIRSATFYLRNSNTSGRADNFFGFGEPSDRALFWR